MYTWMSLVVGRLVWHFPSYIPTLYTPTDFDRSNRLGLCIIDELSGEVGYKVNGNETDSPRNGNISKDSDPSLFKKSWRLLVPNTSSIV